MMKVVLHSDHETFKHISDSIGKLNQPFRKISPLKHGISIQKFKKSFTHKSNPKVKSEIRRLTMNPQILCPLKTIESDIVDL